MTTEGAPISFPRGRIATFDNDGTLWVEHPIYIQFAFALDRVKTLAPQHPEWSTTQPFQAALQRRHEGPAAAGEKGARRAHHGDACRNDDRRVRDDCDRLACDGRHPHFNRPYTELVYQPMLEVLAYLRANGFTTYIVSGGGIEFMRPGRRHLRHSPGQVVGSSIKTQFEMRDGTPVLFRLPQIDFVDDGPGKPVGILQHIGRRPIAAFGNSDGDLRDAAVGDPGGGARFGLIVHHTDAEREYAYDRQSSVGQLDKALDAAAVNGWTVVDMKDRLEEGVLISDVSGASGLAHRSREGHSSLKNGGPKARLFCCALGSCAPAIVVATRRGSPGDIIHRH